MTRTLEEEQLPPAVGVDIRKLWEKRLDEVIKEGAHFAGEFRLPQEERDESNIEIPSQATAPVTVNFHLLRHWRKMYVAVGLMNKRSQSKIQRLATLHGHSIILHNLGKDAIREFRTIIPMILANDEDTHERLDRVNCNIKLQFLEGDRTSLSLGEDEAAQLGLVAAVLCIPREKYITVCQCYSIRTHPLLIGYLPDINENIRRFESRQNFRRESI